MTRDQTREYHAVHSRRGVGAGTRVEVVSRDTMKQPGEDRGCVSEDARTWADLESARRHQPATLERDRVPDEPGVYAWFRDGNRMYVGKADSLRDRVCGNHLGQSKAPTGSAFRRNVAEHLGYGSSAAIKKRELELTAEQLVKVRTWILSCEVAWLTCSTKAGAIAARDQAEGRVQATAHEGIEGGASDNRERRSSALSNAIDRLRTSNDDLLRLDVRLRPLISAEEMPNRP